MLCLDHPPPAAPPPQMQGRGTEREAVAPDRFRVVTGEGIADAALIVAHAVPLLPRPEALREVEVPARAREGETAEEDGHVHLGREGPDTGHGGRQGASFCDGAADDGECEGGRDGDEQQPDLERLDGVVGDRRHLIGEPDDQQETDREGFPRGEAQQGRPGETGGGGGDLRGAGGPPRPPEAEEAGDEEHPRPRAVDPDVRPEDALAGRERPPLELGVDDELGEDADDEGPVDDPTVAGDETGPEQRLAAPERRTEHDGARPDDVTDPRHPRKFGEAEGAARAAVGVVVGLRGALQVLVGERTVPRTPVLAALDGGGVDGAVVGLGVGPGARSTVSHGRGRRVASGSRWAAVRACG